jgi:hypothetical protein
MTTVVTSTIEEVPEFARVAAANLGEEVVEEGAMILVLMLWGVGVEAGVPIS